MLTFFLALRYNRFATRLNSTYHYMPFIMFINFNRSPILCSVRTLYTWSLTCHINLFRVPGDDPFLSPGQMRSRSRSRATAGSCRGRAPPRWVSASGSPGSPTRGSTRYTTRWSATDRATRVPSASASSRWTARGDPEHRQAVSGAASRHNADLQRDRIRETAASQQESVRASWWQRSVFSCCGSFIMQTVVGRHENLSVDVVRKPASRKLSSECCHRRDLTTATKCHNFLRADRMTSAGLVARTLSTFKTNKCRSVWN